MPIFATSACTTMIYPEKAWPTSSYDFETIRTKNFHYVDKTGDMWRLANQQINLLFLGRPRRFGKSLLTTTLEAYFLGKRNLFEGMEAGQLEAQKGDQAWQVWPVLRFDMSIGYSTPTSLRARLIRVLTDFIQKSEIDPFEGERTPEGLLLYVIEWLAGHQKQPVIIIDEYDHPLAHSLNNGDDHKAYKELLRGFYTVLKGSERLLRFAILTGVSQFRQVNVFSGLNNITDITLDPKYAAICGISEAELRANFEWRIKELAVRKERSLEATYDLLKRYYDGYRFTEADIPLFNPYSVVWCLSTLCVQPYWYDSGAPYVLRVLIPDIWYDFTRLERETIVSTRNKLLSFGNLRSDPIPILFQAGYLSVKGYDPVREEFELGFPNDEVRDSFYDDNQALILGEYEPYWLQTADRFVRQVSAGDIKGFMESLDVLLAKIPYNAKLRGKPIPEVHFQVALFLIFRLTGRDAMLEVASQRGRSDIEIYTRERIYIFELKVNASPKRALAQIKAREYAKPHRGGKRQIILIGMNFNGKTRKFTWKAEEDQA